MYSKPRQGYADKFSVDEFKKVVTNNGAADRSFVEMEDQCWISENNSNTTVVDKKIKMVLNQIISSSWSNFDLLVQFWAPKVGAGGRHYLTTSDQSFAVFGGFLYKGVGWGRKMCMDHAYDVGEGDNEEQFGPPGRVFRNAHAELSPDIRLYNTKEYPLRDGMASCGLRGYVAWPIFDMYLTPCVGVLEFLIFDEGIARIKDDEFRVLELALQTAELRSTHLNDYEVEAPHFRVCTSLEQETIKTKQQSALNELAVMLREVIWISQSSFVAQAWVPCNQCTHTDKNLDCMKLDIVRFCHAYKGDLFVCKSHRVESGKGILGISLSSKNKACFFPDLTRFSIMEEPQTHHLQFARFNSCFSICLQSSFSADNLYILLFFLGNQGSTTYENLSSFLSFLLPTMKATLKNWKIASGIELVVELISFDKGSDEFSSFELHQQDVLPVRFEIAQYVVRKEPRYHQNNKRNRSHFETSTSEKHLRCSDGVVLIKAKFGDDIVKLQLLHSSGIEKLREEVGRRFDLMKRSFKLYYLDEEEWILLECDEDLELCMKTLIALEKTPIQILVKSL